MVSVFGMIEFGVNWEGGGGGVRCVFFWGEGGVGGIRNLVGDMFIWGVF